MNPAHRDFQVGSLAFRIDGGTGMLRRLRYCGHEVLRGIYPAVRDANWATLAPGTTPMTVNATSSSVRIALEAKVATSGVDLHWIAEIEAAANGTLTYHWRARAGATFETNRTGLCVLHPAEVAGSGCTIEHTDGSRTQGRFPASISPHQPFTRIKSVTHRFAPGAEACVRMEGEVFEMEDQRNWTDASFKTYCRPLDWPRPYTVERGQHIEHKVTVIVTGTAPSLAPPSGLRLVVAGEKPIRLPRIGFGLQAPLPAGLYERVRRMKPAHVRVEASAGELDATLRWARADADTLGCAIELAVRSAGPDALAPETLPPGSLVLLFNSDGNSAAPSTIAAWRTHGHSRLGTGTLNHFTELNRFHPPEDGPHSYTAFGMNAQVHAFDDASLLETITQHAVVTQQARTIGAERPVSVSPILLGPSADSADPRLHASFAAAWTVASLVQLTRAEAAHATYFRLHGPGGFVRTEDATPLEQLFLALAGIAQAEAITVEHVGGTDESATPIHPLLLRNETTRRLLIANTAEAALEVFVPFSGFARPLGSPHPGSFSAGVVQLAPRSVWQLDLSA